MTRKTKRHGWMPDPAQHPFAMPSTHALRGRISIKKVPTLLAIIFPAWPAWAQLPPDLGRQLPNIPVLPVPPAQIPLEIPSAEENAGEASRVQSALIQA